MTKIKSFVSQEKTYTVLLRTPSSIVGYLPYGDCCVELCSIRASVAVPVILKGELKSTIKILCKSLGESLMLDAKATEDGQKANLEITLPDGQVSPEMVPIQVEGTSGDTKYTNLVTVLTGYISYAHGKIMGDNVSTPVPRIRVAKNDKGLVWPDTWLIDKKANWPTVQPTHLANTGGSANDTQAMISNGLEKLIKLTSLYK